MLFDWRGFLLVAHEQRNDQRESAQRTSLGRAYYYIYNIGLTAAKAQKFTMVPGKGGTHRQLWSWYQNHPDQRMGQLGIEAYRMYSFRIDADYIDAPIPNIASQVMRQISRAQSIERSIALIQGSTPPPTLSP